MKSILFVCTANQCRSPIAVATFYALLQDLDLAGSWSAHSAGTWTQSGLAVGSRSTELAKMVNVDLSTHRTTSVADLHLPGFDWIIVMERGHLEALQAENPGLKPKIKLLTSAAGVTPSDIPDPLLFDLVSAKDILFDMQACVQKFSQRLSGIPAAKHQ